MRSLIGVAEVAGGIALAQVDRAAGSRPRLQSLDVLPQGQPGELPAVVRQRKLQRSRCVGVIDTAGYSLLQVEPPDVPDEELQAAIRWSIKDLVEFPLDEAVVDVFRVPQAGMGARGKIAYAVAAPLDSVRQQVELLRAAKLKISAIDIPEMALRNLAAFLPEDRAGVALLFLSEHDGLITVTRNQHLYLARRLNLGLQELREIFVETPPSSESDQGNPGQFRIDSMVLEIQRSLDFYESTFAQPPIGTLVLAPSCAQVPELQSYFSNYLGATVRTLDCSELIDCDLQQVGLEPAALLAVGAALRTEGDG